MVDQPIVLLLDSRQPGGIESHVFQLASALKRNRWPIEVCFYRRYSVLHPLEVELNDAGVKVRYLNGTLRELNKTIKDTRPLVLHTHGYKANTLGRVVGLINRIPVVSTFHNGDRGTGRVRLYTLLDELSSVLSQNIIVNKEMARRWIHRPIKLSNFIQIPEKQLHSGQAVAFVGRLSHEKGPDLFLQLAKHQPMLSFHMYGSGPMASKLKEQEVSNVSFMGQVTSMNTHWRDIGLLCITSREEGLPMVALEAMANGIPVISFPLGGLPELITQGYNGWTTPPGDLTAMSSLVQFWMSLPEVVKLQLSQSCRDTISREYSSRTIVPGILSVYRQAIDIKGQPVPELFSEQTLKNSVNHQPDNTPPPTSSAQG
ncbi:glycosyltransferase family 4 protein [Endozoicomonas ascidiicola]|uniref:glycosyltransferase family 4 protein n=1 Tax=Endozoicomonas ascidiicola TaxID=1698521 RepID=UPI00083611EA|nr:glycosyltransferase family 4 protein [Endozoicomonas ascidiicola]